MSSLRFPPLLRFQYRARVTRGRVIITGLYVVLIALLSLRSPTGMDTMTFRMILYWGLSFILWPLWIADDDVDFEGPVRVFTTPRHDMRNVILSYLVARNLLAVTVALISVLVLFNRNLFGYWDEVLPTLLISTGICLVLANLSSFLGVFARGKSLIALLYLSLTLIVALIAYTDYWVNKLLSAVLFPVELSFSGLALIHGESPFQFAAWWEPISYVTCSIVWAGLAFLAFRRRFR